MRKKQSVECKTCQDNQYVIIPGPHSSKAEICKMCTLDCRKCDGTGFVFSQDPEGRDIVERCSCQDLKGKIEKYNRAGIPGKFYDATLDNFETRGKPQLKKALDLGKSAVGRYHNGEHRGYIFMGSVGVGKTRLVCSMLREYIFDLNLSCLFYDFSRLLSEIKAGYDAGISEARILDRLVNVDVLVVDELGKGRKNDWEIYILDNIISPRYNLKKLTIFTTNYTDEKNSTYIESYRYKSSSGDYKKAEIKDTLKDRVHSRIYSRIKEMCDFCDMTGEDFRDQQNSDTGFIQVL